MRFSLTERTIIATSVINREMLVIFDLPENRIITSETLTELEGEKVTKPSSLPLKSEKIPSCLKIDPTTLPEQIRFRKNPTPR